MATGRSTRDGKLASLSWMWYPNEILELGFSIKRALFVRIEVAYWEDSFEFTLGLGPFMVFANVKVR